MLATRLDTMSEINRVRRDRDHVRWWWLGSPRHFAGWNLRNIRRNSVQRGLVASREVWRWSSFRFLFFGEARPVAIPARSIKANPYGAISLAAHPSAIKPRRMEQPLRSGAIRKAGPAPYLFISFCSGCLYSQSENPVRILCL